MIFTPPSDKNSRNVLGLECDGADGKRTITTAATHRDGKSFSGRLHGRDWRQRYKPFWADR